MKKFKFIFFLYLIVLVSFAFYLDKTDNLNFKLMDAVYSKDDIRQAVKLEKAVLDLGMLSEEDVTIKMLGDDHTIKFNITALSNDNDRSTMSLKLNNNYPNKKIDVEIKCLTTSDSILVYPDKNNYIIDGNEGADVLITVQLNKNNISSNMNIDFQCEIVSSILSN